MSRTEKRQKLSSSEDESGSDTSQKGEDFELMMDDEEREKFDKMTEKEREIEIYKRLEQREIMKTREQIKKKLEMAGKKGEAEASSSSNKQNNKRRKRRISEESNKESDEGKSESAASAEEGEVDDKNSSADEQREKKAKKRQKVEVKTEPDESDGALDTEYHKPSELTSKQNKRKAMADLLSKRRDKKHAEEKRKKEQKAALDLDEIFGGNDDEEGKSLSSSSSSSSSRSSSPDLNRSRSTTPVPKQEIQTREELLRCQIPRFKLAKFVHAPFFAKTVVGCFVRISIGPNNADGQQVYRVAQVVDVVETAKIYEVNGERTNKGLKLKACEGETARVFRLAFISDHRITDDEFSFWLKRMRASNSPLPMVDFVDRKRKEIAEAVEYRHNDSEISSMVKEKQRFRNQPVRNAYQKAELQKAMAHAEQVGDLEKLRDLKQQINELDEKTNKIDYQRMKNLSAVNSINQRNRDYMKNAFLSGLSVSGVHEKDDDPFTRKSARMKMVSGSVKTKMAGVCSSSTMSMGGPSSSSVTNSPNKKEPQLNSANDLFSAHKEFDINLNLPAVSGGSFKSPLIMDPQIPRMPQKASSTRSLTLEEYKRKRGLI